MYYCFYLNYNSWSYCYYRYFSKPVFKIHFHHYWGDFSPNNVSLSYLPKHVFLNLFSQIFLLMIWAFCFHYLCFCSEIKQFSLNSVFIGLLFFFLKEAKSCFFFFLKCVHPNVISHSTFIRSVLFTKYNPGDNLRFRQEDWQLSTVDSVMMRKVF